MKHNNEPYQNMEHCVGGPSYRWKRAEQCASSQRRSPSRQLDGPTQQAAAFLRTIHQFGEERAKREYPAVSAACTLVQDDEAIQVLKMSLVGNLPRTEIAARLGAELEIIEIAEALFFYLAGMRNAKSWMYCHVFKPVMKAGDTDLAAKMKLAFQGGPVITRALLDAAEDLPLDDAQRLLNQDTLLHTKLQTALEFELDATSTAEFAKVFLAYDLARRQLELERERMRHEWEITLNRRQQSEVELPQECKQEP